MAYELLKRPNRMYLLYHTLSRIPTTLSTLLITVLVIVCSLLSGSLPAFSAGEIGDLAIRPAPPAPPLPAAGGKFNDPTYGTEILRVTDRNDGAQAFHSYSLWSPFNYNSTRFRIFVDGAWVLYNFDPVKFTSTKIGKLSPPVNIDLDTARWHPTNPDLMYAIMTDTQSRRLYSYNVAMNSASLVYDFSSVVPLGGYPFSLSSSEDGRYLAFVGTSTTERGQDFGDFLVVYDTQTQKVYSKNVLQDLGIKNVHSAFLDKSGKYLAVYTGYTTLNVSNLSIWNFTAGTFERLVVNPEDSPTGHWVLGNGIGINPSWYGGQYIVRNLETPHSHKPILQFPLRDGKINWQEDTHISWNNIQPQFFFHSEYIASRVSGWQLHTGAIYKRDAFKQNSLTPREPEGVYHNGKALTKVNAMPTGVGQWYYDVGGDTLYVWLFNGANATDNANVIVPFAWWPLVDEIIQVWVDEPTNLSKFRRLAHHQSHWYNTDGYSDSPRASADRSGQYVLWTSNWGGSGHRDVFILKVPSTATAGTSNPTPTPTPTTSPAPPPPPSPPAPTGPVSAPKGLKVK